MNHQIRMPFKELLPNAMSPNISSYIFSRMADYYKLINTEGYGKSQLVDAGPETLTQATRGLVKEDKMFRTFKKQIALEPKQVLRFQPGGNPLLVREEESQDLIPPCSSCGSTRQFEFQVSQRTTNWVNLVSQSQTHPSLLYGEGLVNYKPSFCSRTTGSW